MAQAIIYATSVVDGKIMYGTVTPDLTHKGWERVVIKSRNGDEIIIDRDGLDTLIAALKQASELIKNAEK